MAGKTYKYNPKRVTVTINGYSLNGQGFVEDAKSIEIIPPADTAGVVEDKDGNTRCKWFKNSTIGQIKFTLLQGTPAQARLQMLHGIQDSSQIDDIVVRISCPNDNLEFFMKDAVIKESARSQWSTKIESREWTIEGSLTQNQLPLV